MSGRQTHAARGDRCAGVGPHGGRRSRSPTLRARADHAAFATSSCPANWMAACGERGDEDAEAFRCGKGRGRHGAMPGAWPERSRSVRIRMSMRHALDRRRGRSKNQVIAPLSLVRLRASPPCDGCAAGRLTPQLRDRRYDAPAHRSRQRSRTVLAGSALAQVLTRGSGGAVPDLSTIRRTPQSRWSLMSYATVARRFVYWPITTAATAASGRRSARWRSPATWA